MTLKPVSSAWNVPLPDFFSSFRAWFKYHLPRGLPNCLSTIDTSPWQVMVGHGLQIWSSTILDVFSKGVLRGGAHLDQWTMTKAHALP